MEKSDYIPFGDIARSQMGMQCQYGSRYLEQTEGYTWLGEGIRYTGNCRDYHFIKMMSRSLCEDIISSKQTRNR